MKTETCHFWIGKFESEDDFFDFVGEDDVEYYKEDDNKEEKFLSKFSRSQGETWYDHDFIESGFEADDKPLTEKFKHYSYADQWTGEIVNRSGHLDPGEINTIVFISKNEIENPVSVKGSNFYLEYLGEIAYQI